METFNKHYSLLNKNQKKAVNSLEGPLLVLAGPGTGKTQLLSLRAANIIISKKISPEKILILTFTNAAARAMRARLADILGMKGYEIEVETFHTFANSIVLNSEGALNFVKDKIDISDVERVRAMTYIMDNVKGAAPLRPFGSPYHHCRELIARISELKNDGISPEELRISVKTLSTNVGDSAVSKEISKLRALSCVYEAYEELKDKRCAILFDKRGRKDYDDMILIATKALKKDFELSRSIKELYKYVMVDEYQDTNGAQLELLFSIIDDKNPNICCVGDDDQSIFRFQGATLSNFKMLREKFQSLNTVTLTDNYRSTGEIVTLAGKIINRLPIEERIGAKDLISKTDYQNKNVSFLKFTTIEEELSFIVGKIKKISYDIKKDKTLKEEERVSPLNNIAILVRKRDQILYIIDALLKSGIPYATDGDEDISGEKRVRQMLDVLELVWDDTSRSSDSKSLTLYKILLSDYVEASHSDILKFIDFVNDKKRSSRLRGEPVNYTFYSQFIEHFAVFSKDTEGIPICPKKSESAKLEIAGLLKLFDPFSIHRAAWAIEILSKDSVQLPVHDMLLRYIENLKLYNYILKRYDNEKVIRVRDLRALTSFINMIKRSDLSKPGITLNDFMEELELKKIHGLSIKGDLATQSQEGVRIYTAHRSKGLEFHSVFIPFCIDQKSWPNRGKADAISIPPDFFKDRSLIEEKEKKKLLKLHDELRLFYVASSRAKANLFYTATPEEKVIVSQFIEYLELNNACHEPIDEEDFLINYLKGIKKTDPFSGTESILRDLLEHITLNPTSLNNYITCKRKFLYDNVLMLPGRKNQHLTFGNCAHKALEEVYLRYMECKKFPNFDFFKKEFEEELGYAGVNHSIKKWCLDRLETLKGWYIIESADPVMPLALENKLEITLKDGVLFRGAFDKIEKDEKGRLSVIDYKTGKPDKHIKAIFKSKDVKAESCDDYLRQIVSYKLLYDRSSDKNKKVKGSISKGILQFLEPVGEDVKKYDLIKGQFIKHPIEIDGKMVKDLEELIVEKYKEIRSLKFNKLPVRDGKTKCSRCEYDSICWGD